MLLNIWSYFLYLMNNTNKSYDPEKSDTQIKMTCIILKNAKSSYQHLDQTVIHNLFIK